MSDFNSSLPVRTENSGDIAAKIVDATTPSQGLEVDSSGRITTKLQDGSGNPLTSQVSGSQQALDVGINVAGVQIDPRLIRPLVSSDVVTAAQGAPAASNAGYWWMRLTDGTNDTVLAPASTAADALQAALVVALSPNSPLPAGSNLIGSVNQGTSPWITKDQSDGSASGGTAGSFSSLAGGLYNSSLPTLTTGQQAALQLDSSGRLIIRPLTSADVVTSNQGTAGTAAQGWFTKITDGTNTAAVKAASTAAGASDPSLVVALSPNSPVPAGSNLIGQVNLDVGGSLVSASNPVPVTISSTVAGTPVQNYNTASALAAAASSNHDYTVTAAKTLNLARIFASASGKLKIEVQIETGAATGVFNSKFVGFNSTATPNIDISVVTVIAVAAGVRVRVIRTNLDKASMDVYSTIEGTEV